MIEFIKKDKVIFAQIIRSNFKRKKGITFFTKPNLNQQVAYMNHAKGHKIIPHHHKKTLRRINKMSEVLIILDGKMKVNFYDKRNKLFKFVVLKKSDIIILLNGGHGFEILKNCKFIEVKQGPFYKSKDKTRF